MSDRPFRLRVQDALTACLEQIRPINGYTFDLAGAVFRGRDTFGDSDPLPMVAILEPPVPPDQIDTPRDETGGYGTWELLLQGFVDSDPANPKNPTDPAHFLLADVKRALAKEKKRARDWLTLGFENGRVEIKAIGQGVVRPADEVSAKAYFWLNVTLRIAEDHEDPFA